MRIANDADEFRSVAERHVMDLDVLPRGDVALVERRVLLDRVREGLHLLGRDAAEGQLDPDHLDVGLALAVDALLQAELDELVALELAVEEAARLRVEVVELPLEDRDDVPGDVLVDLGVGKSPPPAGRIGGHARALYRVKHESGSGFSYSPR